MERQTASRLSSISTAGLNFSLSWVLQSDNFQANGSKNEALLYYPMSVAYCWRVDTSSSLTFALIVLSQSFSLFIVHVPTNTTQLELRMNINSGLSKQTGSVQSLDSRIISVQHQKSSIGLHRYHDFMDTEKFCVCSDLSRFFTRAALLLTKSVHCWR